MARSGGPGGKLPRPRGNLGVLQPGEQAVAMCLKLVDAALVHPVSDEDPRHQHQDDAVRDMLGLQVHGLA